MLKAKHQTFNDGMASIYTIANTAQAGDMPKEGLILKQALRYKERTVGVNRYHIALQNNVKISAVIRCLRIGSVLADDVMVLADNNQYRIVQIQYPEDVEPPVMDLSLERLGEIYDIK